jgi:hypothetical protein
MERNIVANYTAFGKTPEPDELEELYATCLRIALKERSGEYLQGVKKMDAKLKEYTRIATRVKEKKAWRKREDFNSVISARLKRVERKK